MEDANFKDHYEILEISPNASSEAIERMFRYLARRYHPDNPNTADRDRFDLVLEAYNTLRDAVSRVRYDISYKEHSKFRFELAEEVSGGLGVGRDVDIQNKLLAIFYARRRSDVRNAGVGDGELEHLLDCPIEHIQFHLWYMREKGWVARQEDGTLAITAGGVDRASAENLASAEKKLLTDQS